MTANTEFGTSAMETARERSQQLLGAAQQRSRELADSAQRYVHENPVRAVTYTSAALFGLGIIIGRLLAPDRHPMDDVAARAAQASSSAQTRAQEMYEAARDTTQAVMGTAQKRSRELFAATQDYVEEHPGQAATVAALALLAVAALASYTKSGEQDTGT